MFPATSGICDPPGHAIAVERVLAVAAAAGGRELGLTRGWASHLYPGCSRSTVTSPVAGWMSPPGC